MMIEISEHERDIIAALIQREVTDLGPEIRRTDTRNYRDELKEQKKKLQELLKRLTMAEIVQ